MADPAHAGTSDSFRARALFTAFAVFGVGALFLAAWVLRTLLLVTFLAVVFAVMLSHLGGFVHRHAGLSRRLSVIAVTLAIVALFATGGVLLAPTLAEQVPQLAQKIPEAAAAVQRRLGEHPWLDNLWDQFSSGLSLPDPGDAVGQAGRIIGGVSASLGYAGLALVGAVFLALEPDLYRRGLLRLTPVRHRPFADELLTELRATIVAWLGGQLLLMVFIGVLVGLGLWVIGVPYALALGLLAGLLEFVPYLGPILSATPAILLALTDGTTTALWTLLLIIAVQQIENNVLQPLIQESQVHIPPVLLLVTLFAMGKVFGVAGLIAATPLLAVVLVIVRRVYVERILEGRSSPAEPVPVRGMAGVGDQR
jgi:predicted PurR-regulated permease PerM